MVTTTRWIAAGALPGREHPDASEAPVGRVDAGSVLVELERLGLWVRVETSDGKRFWVDGRRLDQAAPVTAADGPSHHEEAAPVESAPESAPPPLLPSPPVRTVTHTVPLEGLQAWAQPDPTGAIIANLAGGVELRVQERRADWAHVIAENGWQGWVDGRRLVAVRTVTPQPQPPAPAVATVAKQSGTTSISLRSVAAVMVPISAFLPWVGSWYGQSSTATDVPAAFLWSPYADLSFPNMGTVMIVAGVAVLVTEFMDRFARYRRLAAGVVVGVVALYLVQMFRLFLDWESQFTTAVSTMFTEGLAIGPLVALAAGITLLVRRQPKPGGPGA